MTDRADRAALSRALEKAIAYRDCGKEQMAEAWAAELVRLLDAMSIIDPEYLRFAGKRGLLNLSAEG